MRMRVVFAAVLMVTLLVGCGGGDDSGAGGDTSSPQETTATDDTASSPKPEPAEDELVSCAEEPKKGKVFKVATPAFKFVPSTIKAPAGDVITVEYQNKDTAPHTFTIELLENLDCSLAPTGDEPMTGTFAMPEGTTKFYCAIHPSMTGKLIGT